MARTALLNKQRESLQKYLRAKSEGRKSKFPTRVYNRCQLCAAFQVEEAVVRYSEGGRLDSRCASGGRGTQAASCYCICGGETQAYPCQSFEAGAPRVQRI